MPWAEIQRLLGPGLHWQISQERFISAIAEAQRLNLPNVVGFLELMLKERNLVMFESPLPRD